jgi:hypothetical protein
MTNRYFTLEEAEAILPDVSGTMKSVQDLKRRIDEKVVGWQKELPDAPAEQAIAKGQVDFLISEINQKLQKVVRMGVLPKDLDVGLVDFPARIEGKEGYLCWKVGEDRIRFWHGITEGFSGRKPLKDAIRNR